MDAVIELLAIVGLATVVWLILAGFLLWADSARREGL